MVVVAREKRGEGGLRGGEEGVMVIVRYFAQNSPHL